MTAYFFAAIEADDLSWVEAYQAHVPGIMRRHGGDFLAVSDHIRRYEGSGPDPDNAVLMTFPSMEAVEAVLTDPAYAPHRAARRAASSGDAFAFAAS
jgi:uncharacterized protein (DUF1330 family)